MSKDPHKYTSLPVPPSYEESESSRPPTAQSNRGLQESHDDAERETLLDRDRARSGPASQRNGNYQAPTVESERNSYESDFTSPELSSDEEEEELRRDLEQMEVQDESAERRAQQRARMRQQIQKRIMSITNTFSNIHLPRMPVSFPSIPNPFRYLSFGPSDRIPISFPVIARLVALMIIAALVYLLVIARIVPSRGMIMGQRFDPELLRTVLMSSVEPSKIESYLREVSYDSHLAGTKGDFFLAEYIENHFEKFGLDTVYTEDFEVYLNYPQPDGRRVAIIDPPELAWQAILEEDPNKSDGDSPFLTPRHQVPVFHGHSRSGNVTGPLVYANYGSRDDFDYLKNQGVHVNGSIALVRYYGTQSDRALKVKAAELAGAVGCLIYSDPAEDGFVRGPPGPEGPWRTPDSVQRGSVSLMSWVVGDVLTPGWASTPDSRRLSLDEPNAGLVNIPSLPLSWRDAETLLRSIQDKGLAVPPEWQGGIPDVAYFTGNASSDTPTVHLMNLQEENARQPIRNVLGKVEGLETPDSEIIVGNHRDAWCFGAADPGTGTAVFLEVVRIFGALLGQGTWRPRRSITFASWDGEEYNLIGSTEHVESRIDALRRNGVAYLNVDTGVSGPDVFRAAGSPVFRESLVRALAHIPDAASNGTLLDRWNATSGATLEGLGAGSDYVAFQDMAGTSSLDMSFTGTDAKAFPYHSCHSTLAWIKAHGDPDWTASTQLAQVLALMILELADAPLIPFDFPHYADQMQRYVSDLTFDIDAATEETSETIDTSALFDAAALFHDSAATFADWQERWRQEVTNGPVPGTETRATALDRLSHNLRAVEFETGLLDLGYPGDPAASDASDDAGFDPAGRHKGGRAGGVPGREQFKNVVFGPKAWSGYDEAYFPGVRDALEARDWAAVRLQVEIVAETIKAAAGRLGQ